MSDAALGQDQFQPVNRRAGYGDALKMAMSVARKGGTLSAGEGLLIIEHYEEKLAAARKDAARKDAITRESAIAALVEMGAIEWTHASVSQPFVDGGFDVRYAKHVIILPDAALTPEDA